MRDARSRRNRQVALLSFDPQAVGLIRHYILIVLLGVLALRVVQRIVGVHLFVCWCASVRMRTNTLIILAVHSTQSN